MKRPKAIRHREGDLPLPACAATSAAKQWQRYAMHLERRPRKLLTDAVEYVRLFLEHESALPETTRAPFFEEAQKWWRDKTVPRGEPTMTKALPNQDEALAYWRDGLLGPAYRLVCERPTRRSDRNGGTVLLGCEACESCRTLERLAVDDLCEPKVRS